jgi:hypothetical protein
MKKIMKLTLVIASLLVGVIMLITSLFFIITIGFGNMTIVKVILYSAGVLFSIFLIIEGCIVAVIVKRNG